MSSSAKRVLPLLFRSVSHSNRRFSNSAVRFDTFTATDGVVEKPIQSKLISYVFVGGAVVSGLSTGAWMSKNIASFLEENELFVPSDDDDDY